MLTKEEVLATRNPYFDDSPEGLIWHAALSAVADRMGGGEWQPIETAPKEGRYLVAADNGVVDLVMPHDVNGWVYGDRLRAPIRANATTSQYGGPSYKITHWMPLPQAIGVPVKKER